MDFSDKMSIRGSFSVPPSTAAASEFGDVLSLGLTSVTENLKRFMASFPKEIKRKNLQDLYLALVTGKLEESEECVDAANALLALLFNTGTPYLDRLVGVNCLQLLTPQPDLCSTIASGEMVYLSSCLGVILTQGLEDKGFHDVIAELIKYLVSTNCTNYVQKIMYFFNQLLIYHKAEISSENITMLTEKLLEVFSKDSTKSSSLSPSADSRVKRIEANMIVKEMDGTISVEAFTALSIPDFTSPEQLLKIQYFSMLLSWLLSICDLRLDPSDEALKMQRHIRSSVCISLRDYAMRLIEQCDRSPLVPGNIELQKACLTEALSILDITCILDREQVAYVLSIVRRIFERNVSMHYQDVSICTSAAQFLIRHSSTMMHKVESIGPHLFGNVIGNFYHDPAASFEVIKFVRDNLTRLCYHSSLLERYFPSLLKILAWHPNVFEDDFTLILPAFMSSQTAIEVFHSLIDLPCLTASLILCQASLKQSQSGADSLVDASLIQLYHLPEYQAMFNFVLRPVSGMGHTFDKLSAFHQVIGKLIIHPRVKRCARTSLRLLRCFSQVFLQFGDTALTSLLFPALIERLNLVYPVLGYKEEINEFLAKFLLQLLEKHPSVVIHLHEELVDYVGKVQNALDSPQAFTHMVWAIGEFLSLTYTDLLSPEIVSSYYDALECFIYEFQSLSQLHKEESDYRLTTVLLTSLAQLATKCQDLVPRAILCISKMGQKLMSSQEREGLKVESVVVDRIRELLAILSTPNVASVVLSPPKTIYLERWHEDSTSLPIIFKTIVSLMENENVVVKPPS